MGAFPLQLLGPSPPQPPVEPAEEGPTRVSHVRPINTHQSQLPGLHLRAGELEDVADGLLEHHYDGHLDEEVREASAGVTLEGGGEKCHRKQRSSPIFRDTKTGECMRYLLEPPFPCNSNITTGVTIYPAAHVTKAKHD